MERAFIDNSDCLKMASKAAKGKSAKSPTNNLSVDNKSGRKSARFRDSKGSNKVDLISQKLFLCSPWMRLDLDLDLESIYQEKI